jgi:hypothetical protein
MAALMVVPAPAKAEDESAHDTANFTKSGLFMKPSSGLDIKPDAGGGKNASIFSSRRLPLSDTIDITPVFERQKKDLTDKKRASDQRALIDITFRF